MIPASEALTLPTATLSNEERDAADKLEILIEEHVRKEMTRFGIDLQTSVTNKNVVAEVNYRLRMMGWVTNWQPIVEKHRFNAAMSVHSGFTLSLLPTDESYNVAARAVLS